MMNLKACCGLWATKDDEDHDYYKDSEDPLPKPKNELERAEHFKVCSAFLQQRLPEIVFQIFVDMWRNRELYTRRQLFRVTVITEPLNLLIILNKETHCVSVVS